ncbi:MAG: hypothetical protein HW384_296 [Dehalococcoidia bacterium]|nr:hypothetical protein [Dehalococcoidia bacterium]
MTKIPLRSLYERERRGIYPGRKRIIQPIFILHGPDASGREIPSLSYCYCFCFFRQGFGMAALEALGLGFALIY